MILQSTKYDNQAYDSSQDLTLSHKGLDGVCIRFVVLFGIIILQKVQGHKNNDQIKFEVEKMNIWLWL